MSKTINIEVTEDEFNLLTDGLSILSPDNGYMVETRRDLLQALYEQANNPTPAPDRNIIEVPHVTNQQVTALWEKYQAGLINIHEYADVLATISDMDTKRAAAQREIDEARELYNRIPRAIRESMED